MDTETNRQVVARLFELFEAREWDRSLELFHEDVVVEWPHSGERFRGRDNYVGMNRAYPEGWAIEVRRLVAEGEVVVSEIAVTLGDVVSHAASFFELRVGRIARAIEYWVDAGEQVPPEWRARWTDLGEG